MTPLLLDTHAFLWYSEDDANLPAPLKAAIEGADLVYLSITTLWEIVIKLNLGKLSLQTNYELIEAGLEAGGINFLPVTCADNFYYE
jgi:PIN domain nuclease of toxin-antitoxin system